MGGSAIATISPCLGQHQGNVVGYHDLSKLDSLLGTVLHVANEPNDMLNTRW